MNNSDISFTEKIILHEKLTAYFANKYKNNEQLSDEIQVLIHNLKNDFIRLYGRKLFWFREIKSSRFWQRELWKMNWVGMSLIIMN